MTMNEAELVTAIVASAPDKKLVGRIRLQKVAYLLKQLGAPVPFQFGYYHYGPYASEVEKAVFDAEVRGIVKEEVRARQSDGAQYSIFKVVGDVHEVEEAFREYADEVGKLANIDPVVLELAATAHWLSEVEKVEDWEKEIRLRKTWKVEGERLEKALELLKELGLPPAVAAGNDARH